MLRKILLTVCLITPVFCVAQNGYQIELIVLSNINATSLESEDWPILTKNIINTANTVDLNVPNNTIEAVKSDDLLLTRQQQRLNRYSAYKTIYHIAWRESLSQITKRTTVHIYGGKLYDNEGQVIKTVMNGTIPFSPDQHWELNGTVTINLNHYFNADFILLFALPAQQIASITHDKQNYSGTFKYFQLMESLRTKSHELNFIDHPLYSVLFRIEPV